MKKRWRNLSWHYHSPSLLHYLYGVLPGQLAIVAHFTSFEYGPPVHRVPTIHIYVQLRQI